MGRIITDEGRDIIISGYIGRLGDVAHYGRKRLALAVVGPPRRGNVYAEIRMRPFGRDKRLNVEAPGLVQIGGEARRAARLWSLQRYY